MNWIGWVRGGAGRCIKKPLFLVVDRWKKLLSSRYDSMHVHSVFDLNGQDCPSIISLWTVLFLVIHVFLHSLVIN